MAKGTISMKRFKSNLTKISRLAKRGYNSITSVAKQIISTVTDIASKITILTPEAEWQGASENSLSTGDYQSFYDGVSRAEEKFLNTSLSNLMNYKDEIIHDIFTVSDALAHNADQVYFGVEEALRAEFAGLKDDFFEYGKTGGSIFGTGVEQGIKESMSSIKKNLLATTEDIYSVLLGRVLTDGNVSNVTYSSPNYNFYSSKQTVSQQLSEARRAEAVNALRHA